MTRSLPAAIAAFEPALPLAVALSGGADSSALLLACARKWPGQVVAIHVHHGLQAAADGFEQHCSALCRQVSVPLIVCRVDARPARGESPEDAARVARYRAIDEAVRHADGAVRCPSVALAQHADDQVETMLLALSRGAGLPGLSAMPARRERAGICYHRPLLDVGAAQIRAWLREQGVTPVQDPMNSDAARVRNRIRMWVLPALEAAFGQFRDTFARSARHAAQAQQLLDAMAQDDLQHGVAGAGHGLSMAALRRLPAARQANVLRYWLRTAHGVSPSDAQLRELQAQVAACATRGHRIRIKVGRGLVVREGDGLDWYNGAPDRTLGG